MPNRIVTDDSFSIGSHSDIALKTIAAVIQGKIEGRQAIFGYRANSTCSAMTKQQRAWHAGILPSDTVRQMMQVPSACDWHCKSRTKRFSCLFIAFRTELSNPLTCARMIERFRIA
jgi:hypothetical protein